MAINIFEGSRRSAKLVAALWIAGVLFFTLTQGNPYITATYTISSINSPPVRSDPSCKYSRNNASENITVRTKKGTEADVALCFSEEVEFQARLQEEQAAAKTQNAWRSAPLVWDAPAYIRAVKETFILPQAEEEWIDGQWWSKRWEQVWQGALVLVGGLVFLWVFTWITGWIVRGFLGIPRGQDCKTK